MLQEDAFNDFDDDENVTEDPSRPSQLITTPAVEPTVVKAASATPETSSILPLPKFKKQVVYDDLPDTAKNFVPKVQSSNIEVTSQPKHNVGIGFKYKAKKRVKAAPLPEIILTMTRGDIPSPFEEEFDITGGSQTVSDEEVIRQPGETMKDWEWRTAFVERNRQQSIDINSVILYSKLALNVFKYNVRYDPKTQKRLSQLQ